MNGQRPRLTGKPVTEEQLLHDFRGIGVMPGTSLIVHSSLSAIGWVLGGAPTVIRALARAVGETGNLAMPAATPWCADPATWRDPKVPQAWLDDVRNHLPLFDVDTTPTSLGAIPEALNFGAGAETRIPMAISIIGGVSLSTFLTLYVVPCVYSLCSRFERPEKEELPQPETSHLADVHG